MEKELKVVTRYISTNETMSEIMDFIAELSREMLISGANVERVNLAVRKIAHAYGLHDVCPYILSTRVGVSARMDDGTYAFRQLAVKGININLERLRSLNRLSYTVCKELPDPQALKDLLYEACNTKEYSWLPVFLFNSFAMGLMSLFFGAGVKEVLCVLCIVFLLKLLAKKIERLVPDHMMVNVVSMFIATSLAVLLHKIHFCDYPVAIITTLIMMYLPGIPLVNAARNLFCGNELNGIIELCKALLETGALTVGMILALTFFGVDMTSIPGISSPLLLVIVSFMISTCLGLSFGIVGKDIFLAGGCGALCRIVLITASQYTPNRLLYIFTAAFSASLLAEILATYRREPSTYLIYPSILPLIPGDLFFAFVLGLCTKDMTSVHRYGVECANALIGMSAGFMVSTSVAVYLRKIKFLKAGGILFGHRSHMEKPKEKL